MATLTASGVNFSDGSTMNGTTFNTIGAYVAVSGYSLNASAPSPLNTGTSIAGSYLRQSTLTRMFCGCGSSYYYTTTSSVNANTSGTYRYMSDNLFVRIA